MSRNITTPETREAWATIDAAAARAPLTAEESQAMARKTENPSPYEPKRTPNPKPPPLLADPLREPMTRQYARRRETAPRELTKADWIALHTTVFVLGRAICEHGVESLPQPVRVVLDTLARGLPTPTPEARRDDTE